MEARPKKSVQINLETVYSRFEDQLPPPPSPTESKLKEKRGIIIQQMLVVVTDYGYSSPIAITVAR